MHKMEEIMDTAAYLPYIDVADCLNRVRGNKKLFLMMLKSFKADPIFPKAYAAALQGDRAGAQMQMHTLKGVAGNLSLKRLYELVVPVEAALKAEIPDLADFKPVEEAFEKTLAAIDGLLADYAAEGAI